MNKVRANSKRNFKITQTFVEFTKSQQFSGILLLLCTTVSIIICNSSLRETYIHFWHHTINFNFFGITTQKNIEFIVNDGLMSIFFLLVGLEIKRELQSGELSTLKKASLPVIAAIGGMLVPALIFYAFNFNIPTCNGWGIPMATDIAFAIGILSLLGNRIPITIKVLLTALAVADDLGAIIVIAVFYAQQLQWAYLLGALIVFSVLLILNRLKINYLFMYLLLGLVLWFFVLKGGIHATLSGVLLAFAIPSSASEKQSSLHRLEHNLHGPVNNFIMPLFALANTCIVFMGITITNESFPLAMGIIAGLLIGKPLGICSSIYVAVKLKLTHLPDGVNWKLLTGTGFLGGIGFTMSIFISLIAFSNNQQYVEIAKVSVLVASLLAGITGALILMKKKRD